jgi:hypothetical protein
VNCRDYKLEPITEPLPAYHEYCAYCGGPVENIPRPTWKASWVYDVPRRNVDGELRTQLRVKYLCDDHARKFAKKYGVELVGHGVL